VTCAVVRVRPYTSVNFHERPWTQKWGELVPWPGLAARCRAGGDRGRVDIRERPFTSSERSRTFGLVLERGVENSEIVADGARVGVIRAEPGLEDA
jgi:hypothetical protein